MLSEISMSVNHEFCDKYKFFSTSSVAGIVKCVRIWMMINECMMYMNNDNWLNSELVH